MSEPYVPTLADRISDAYWDAENAGDRIRRVIKIAKEEADRARAEGRAEERRDVVAWLSDDPSVANTLDLAGAVDRGVHVRGIVKGEP